MASSTGWRGTFQRTTARFLRGRSLKGRSLGPAGVGRGTYFGPGAPAGPRYHHYVFELYALSKTLDPPADAMRAQLLDAMKDIIVGKAAYVGRFKQ